MLTFQPALYTAEREVYSRAASAVLRSVIVALALLAVATPSVAQIYSWRDAGGTLVLSDRPLSDDARPVTSAPVDPVHSRNAGSPDRNAPADYEHLIDEHARRHNIRPDLVRAVIQAESAFNPAAVSPKGAMGLMQLMPATARSLGVGNPFDPHQNVRGGVAYLRQLLDRYDNNEKLALAAYNAGPGAVDRYGQTIPPYPETRNYVARISEVARVTGSDGTPSTTIYRTVEVIDGREVVRYSDRPR
jgi:soluble lytic murein transglycosylase-like protein